MKLFSGLMIIAGALLVGHGVAHLSDIQPIAFMGLSAGGQIAAGMVTECLALAGFQLL